MWNCGVTLARLPTKGDDKTTTTMRTTVTISVQGVALNVTGTFTPEEPQTYFEPGCGSKFDIEEITVAEPHVCIYDLLTSVVSMEVVAAEACEAVEMRESEAHDDQWEQYCEHREAVMKGRD